MTEQWELALRRRFAEAKPSDKRYRCLACWDTGWAVIWTKDALDWIEERKDGVMSGEESFPPRGVVYQTVAVCCSCGKGGEIHGRAGGARLTARDCVYLRPCETFEAAAVRTVSHIHAVSRPTDWMTGQKV